MLAICPSEECLSSLRRVLLRQVIDLEHLSSESCSRRGKVLTGHLHRVPISGTPFPGYPQRECLLLYLHIQRSIFREQSQGTGGHLERDATPRYITPSLLLTVNPYAGLRSRYSSPKMVRSQALSASDQQHRGYSLGTSGAQRLPPPTLSKKKFFFCSRKEIRGEQ